MASTRSLNRPREPVSEMTAAVMVGREADGNDHDEQTTMASFARPVGLGGDRQPRPRQPQQARAAQGIATASMVASHPRDAAEPIGPSALEVEGQAGDEGNQRRRQRVDRPGAAAPSVSVMRFAEIRTHQQPNSR